MYIHTYVYIYSQKIGFDIILILGCMLEYESFHFKIVTTFYVEDTLDKIFGTVSGSLCKH